MSSLIVKIIRHYNNIFLRNAFSDCPVLDMVLAGMCLYNFHHVVLSR